jgi:hypothetical protein
MLVGNKFLFLKIPRTGTTSFERSCFLANLEVKYPTDQLLTHKRAATGNSPLRHSHEPVSLIREVFGYDYPIVAIKRDELDRFISAWKYCIKNLEDVDFEAAQILKQVDNKTFIEAWIEILGYSAQLNEVEKITAFVTYLVGRSIPFNLNFYSIFSQTLSGPSRWHENNPDILYFDFKNLGSLEKYVKENVDISYELIISNHTKTQKTNLKPTDELKEFYCKWVDPIYKSNNTLI